MNATKTLNTHPAIAEHIKGNSVAIDRGCDYTAYLVVIGFTHYIVTDWNDGTPTGVQKV